MNVHKTNTKKTKAQAMVEFALVLPILLLLLYGILEAGRLLFIYSTIVTASRQAVRYGSATGQGLDYTAQGGPDNTGIPRYQDCFGIRLAAQRVDFLNAIQDDDIIIQYDNGPTDLNPKTFVTERQLTLSQQIIAVACVWPLMAITCRLFPESWVFSNAPITIAGP
jgi:hypothetical protein